MATTSATASPDEVQASKPSSAFQFTTRGLFELTSVVGFFLAVGLFFEHPIAWAATAGAATSAFVAFLLPKAKILGTFPVQVLTLFVFLVFSWPFLAVVWAPLRFLTLAAPFLAVAYFVGRRYYVQLGFFLLLSPFAGAMFIALIDYRAGTARLPPKFSLGEIGPNPERDTRLVRIPWYRPSPMFADFDDWMFDIPYERMLTTTAKICGPMQGSYSGPYPTEEQAIAALKQGETYEVKRDGSLILKHEEIRLQPHYFSRRKNGNSQIVSLGAVYEGQCIILGSCAVAEHGKSQEFTGIALYDRETGRRFAIYPPSGRDKWSDWRKEEPRDIPCNQSHPYKVWTDKVIQDGLPGFWR